MRLPIVLAAAAAVMAGCSSSSSTAERRDCVDAHGNKLPDSSCSHSRVGMYPMFIYGGMLSGNRIVGGSPTSRAATGTQTGTPRGGFGGSSGVGS